MYRWSWISDPPAWNAPNQTTCRMFFDKKFLGIRATRTVRVSSPGRGFQPQRPGRSRIYHNAIRKGRCDEIRRGDAKRVGAPRASTTRLPDCVEGTGRERHRTELDCLHREFGCAAAPPVQRKTFRTTQDRPENRLVWRADT